MVVASLLLVADRHGWVLWGCSGYRVQVLVRNLYSSTLNLLGSGEPASQPDRHDHIFDFGPGLWPGS